MPASGRRPPQRYQTARERVAARRAARRSGGWGALLLAVALVVVFALVALALRRADHTLATIQQNDPRRAPTPGSADSQAQPAAGDPPAALRDPFNILLIGVDKRPNPDDGVRSDTLILVHVNPQARWASLLSIPRDSVVTIPHLGRSKINAAYNYGYSNATEIYGSGVEPDAAGGALTAETVERFLKVKVDYTAEVDFRGFERLVDTLGGVTIDVTEPLVDDEYPTDNYGVERISIPAGRQVMDGRTALIYARSRHSTSDFDRSRRQQQVLRALLDQARARGVLGDLTLLPTWADTLERNIRTTLPIRDLGTLGALATLARELHADQIVQLGINPDTVAMDGEDGSDIYWNQADIAALVARWQAGPPNGAAAARVQVINGAAVAGIAGQVSDYLRAKGFTLADAGTAARVYEHSLVIDYAGMPDARQRLADALGVEDRYVQPKPGSDAPPPNQQADLIVVIGKDYQQRWLGQ